MTTKDDDDWVLPERMIVDDHSHFHAYVDFEERGDTTDAQEHSMVDFEYAKVYVRNLLANLRRVGLTVDGNVLDAGCGVGRITGAFKAVLGADVNVSGIDLAPAGVRAGARDFPECTFIEHSADDLSCFEDNSLSLIHTREFYPFTRSASADIHMRFFQAFARKLRPGGMAVAVQVVEPKGLGNTRAEVGRRCLDVGYDAVFRRTSVPYRLYNRFGEVCHVPVVFGMMSMGLAVLETLRPVTVSYLYCHRKAA